MLLGLGIGLIPKVYKSQTTMNQAQLALVFAILWILRQQLFDELAPDVTAVAELLDRDMGWT